MGILPHGQKLRPLVSEFAEYRRLRSTHILMPPKCWTAERSEDHNSKTFCRGVSRVFPRLKMCVL